MTLARKMSAMPSPRGLRTDAIRVYIAGVAGDERPRPDPEGDKPMSCNGSGEIVDYSVNGRNRDGSPRTRRCPGCAACQKK